MKKISLLLVSVFMIVSCISLQVKSNTVPPEITGKVVYIPFPVDIQVDGILDDWNSISPVEVSRGTMVTDQAGNKGSFSFALAAKKESLYAYVRVVDPHIITGQHDTDFWNEDSLEIYFNFSEDLFATEYAQGIYQININPGDIGNMDPEALHLTGMNSEGADLSGYAFATEDGWACEIEIILPFSVSHGKEIGFQAHVNGASETDRDMKLIWSLADTQDASYNNPRVFGHALFFEYGEETVPLATEYKAPEPVQFVAVNQIGYFTEGPKFAAYPRNITSSAPYDWFLINAETEEVVAEGKTLQDFYDIASRDYVNLIDFSDFTTPGTYYITLKNMKTYPFKIGEDIYTGLPNDAMAYFYRSRTGIDITAELAGSDAWAREAGHLTDNYINGFRGTDKTGQFWEGTDYYLDASKGWYDAGDFGKYVVNGGISVWTLMNSYEQNSSFFADGTLNIPENSNNIPDILDESRWEMEFLLGMQVPEGYDQAGMVHHKLHGVHWDALPAIPPTEYDNDPNHTDPDSGRYLMPPSTAATLNLAATAAQAARLWTTFDSEFSEKCLSAAEKAWQAALDNPIFLYGDIPGDGGGPYDDPQVDDEFFWAAAELFITTGKAEYADYLRNSPYLSQPLEFSPQRPSVMDWGNVSALGKISLCLAENNLEKSEIENMEDQIVDMATYYLELTNTNGYQVPIVKDGYVWGSNSCVLNNAILMAYAHSFTGNDDFLEGTLKTMNYILGFNGLNFSFVSGYGEDSMAHPLHHYWADQVESGFPAVPPGVICGGPNANPSDPPAQSPEILARGTSKRYIDNSKSYSTNEVAINWNSPLVWVSSYIDQSVNN